MSISAKMREWYTSIEANEFDSVAISIVKVLPKPNSKYTGQLDSLLCRLTHAFMKHHESHKGDLKKGLEVYKLACCLCDRFTESSNPPRLNRGIYHISRCLRELGLYSESMIICDYTKPGKILSTDSCDFEFYCTLAHSWRYSAESLIKSLSEKFDQRTYSILLEIIKYHFGLLLISEVNGGCQAIFEGFQKYLDKVVELDWSQNMVENLFYTITEHLKFLRENSSFEVDPLLIYEEIIGIISCLSIKYMKKDQICKIADVIPKFSKEFVDFIKKDPQTQKCFELHLSFYKILVKPVTKFDKNMLEDIRNYRRQFRRRLETFGASKAIKGNATGIFKVLTPFFNYWHECMKSCSKESINEIVFEVTKLVKYAAEIFAAQPVKNCKCGLDTCKIKKNHFEEINTLQRLASFMCAFDQKSLSKDFLHFARDFIVEVTKKVEDYKSNKCGLYSSLWNACGAILYNTSVMCFLEYLDLSAEMFSNLCSFIIREEGLKSTNTFLRHKNPLSLVLHKLGLVYYKAEKYGEALIVTAFDGLISYEEEESKAFKMWANIKHKCNSEEINKQTMISCLKTYKADIEVMGVDIRLEDYDLVKLNAREIQALQKAKVNLTPAIKTCLDELASLQNTTMEFIEGIQYLGYHAIYFKDDSSISEYIKTAELYLCNYDKISVRYSCVKANLEFFKFVDRLNATSKKIKNDMNKTKNILKSNKNETMIHDQTIESEEVVPVYKLINMKQDAEVVSHLQKVLVKWENCFQKDPKEIIHCWEPEITLDMIIIAGEIARMYLSQSCEKRIWLLAYKLASALENKAASLYITARSVSLRFVNDLWIEKSLGYAETLKSSEVTEDKSAVGMFWISLADLYFEQKKPKEAVKLLKDVKNLGTVDISTDVPVYVDFLDTVIRNYQFYSENMQQEEYSEYIVLCTYSMIAISEALNAGGKMTYYAVNLLFDAVNHMSLVMYSFVSFREISAHLTLRLELAQSLGVTLRVAECLKSLCLIELSRLKLVDCEIKLQGLEQILDVEGFRLSMKTKCPQASVFRSNTILSSQNMDVDDPLRDVIQNEASPILRKKIFIPPEFMLHKNCNCDRCENIPYQYLVFSSTYIRAQIYALKNYSDVALQHFDGAIEIRTKLLEKEKSRIEQESRNSTKLYPWQKYYSMVDYVLFLLDFSKYIKGYRIPREQEAIEIALEALNICEDYKLETHPVYYAAMDLIFQYRFQNLEDEIHGYPVPDVADIDISDLNPAETISKENERESLFHTPVHSEEYPLKVLRRKKTPPLLPLTKVAMSLSDSEDEDSQTSKISRKKPLRKRILNLDLDPTSDEAEIKLPSRTKSSSKAESTLKKSVASKSTKVLVDKPLEDKFKNMSIEPKSLESASASREKLASKELKLKNSQKTQLKLNCPSSNGKSMQAFEKNMSKVIDTLKDTVVSKKSTDIVSSSSKEESLSKNLNSASSKSNLEIKRSGPSRSVSPDLFSSDDECVKISNEKRSFTTRVQESKAELSSVAGAENSNEGIRITRSRSAKISSDGNSAELDSKKVSRTGKANR